jgi:hypothetical protein
MPKNLKDVFEVMITQIKEQSKPRALQAIKVLTWHTHTIYPPPPLRFQNPQKTQPKTTTK